MTEHTRAPAVAGSFYPGDPDQLRALVHQCLAGVPPQSRRCRAALVPHAGLIYSGRCAGAVLGRLAIPGVAVIIAPNHTGRLASPGASLWSRGSFLTPLGAVPIEERFAARLAGVCTLAQHDPIAHRHEHGIEVELPFLRVLSPEVLIVPIVLAWDDWPLCESLARALAEVVGEWPEDVLLLASSDMTHYESAASAARKDRLALAHVEQLDGQGLLETCQRERVTMCGRGPAAVVVETARRLGAKRAEVVDYRHSGAVTGDDRRVVAYASALVPVSAKTEPTGIGDAWT